VLQFVAVRCAEDEMGLHLNFQITRVGAYIYLYIYDKVCCLAVGIVFEFEYRTSGCANMFIYIDIYKCVAVDSHVNLHIAHVFVCVYIYIEVYHLTVGIEFKFKYRRVGVYICFEFEHRGSGCAYMYIYIYKCVTVDPYFNSHIARVCVCAYVCICTSVPPCR